MSGTPFPVFYGYPGSLFQICSVSLAYLGNLLSDNPTPSSIATPAAVALTTFLNGIDSITAWQLSQAWTTELNLMDEIEVLPLSLSAPLQSYLQNRVTGLTAAIPAIQNILPVANQATALSNAQNNIPGIASPNLLTFFSKFNYEPSPSGFTQPQVPAALAAAAAGWASIAQAVLNYQSNTGLTQAFDEAVRTSAALTELSNIQNSNISSFGTFASNSNNTTAWNLMVALPSLLLTANSINATPHSQINQQCAVMRFVLGTAAIAVARLLITLRQLNYGEANLGTLLSNDTLMDLAARDLGDFEEWRQIATLNGLTPPWTGAGGSAKPGQQLLLPTVTGQTPSTGLPLPNYDINVLGVDWYLGPLGSDMLPWTGDIQLIAGPNNLSISLARRLITTIATYLYDSSFGSRIPPEVGAIQTQAEAGLLLAYGTSALLSDARVASVENAEAVLNSTGFGIASFSGTVIPIGAASSADAVGVNAILSPNP